MPSDSARISPTAYYTAQTWVRLGFPHAQLFTTRRGRLFVALYRVLARLTGAEGGESLLVRTLRNRHATLDEAVLASDPDLVVELGAGLSPRSIALAADHAIDTIDIDLPAMLARKRALLARHATPDLSAKLTAHYRSEPLDITDPSFGPRLKIFLAGAARPVVVAEGLIGYFDHPIKQQILAAIHHAFAGNPRATCLFDVRISDSTPEATRTLRLGIRILTRNRGAPPGFPSELSVLDLWHAAGFGHAELLPLRDTATPPVMSRVLLARTS